MKLILLLLLASGIALTGTGCAAITQGLIEGELDRPYERALKSGRMSPLEYDSAVSANHRIFDASE